MRDCASTDESRGRGSATMGNSKSKSRAGDDGAGDDETDGARPLRSEHMSREKFIQLVVPVLEAIYAAKARQVQLETVDALAQLRDHAGDPIFPDGCVTRDDFEKNLKPLIRACYATPLEPWQFRDLNALAGGCARETELLSG